MKHMLHHIFFVFLIFLVPAFPAAAQKIAPAIQTSPKDLELIAVGTIEEIVKADHIRLSDGKTYVLNNIRVPALLSPAVIDYLNKNFLKKKAGIFVNPKTKAEQIDAEGNQMAHIMTEDAVWIQADITSKGLAWVDSTIKSRDLVIPLYELENFARRKKDGLWKDPDYTIRSNENIGQTTGSFQVFEGTIQNVRDTGYFVYVGFGTDPTKDFTLVHNIEDRVNFAAKESFGFQTMTGQRARVRGWIESTDSGPMMYLTHPEQIELVDRIPAKQSAAAPPGPAQ
jgi:hypothetical protein